MGRKIKVRANIMKHRWGNIEEERDKKPQVEVSFNRNDEVAIRMIARWFGMTVQQFKRIIPK